MGSDTVAHPSRAGVVIPIRAFNLGKARLAEELDDVERAGLAELLAQRVLAAAAPLPAVVVSSAPEVRAWAARQRVTVIDDPGSLDSAAAAGRDHLASRGAERVVIAHADLPRARTLDAVAHDGADPIAVIVPCHRGDGTTVLSIPAGAAFRFAYGPGSFDRHRAEARRAGLEVRIVHDPDLAFDIDVPADLIAWARWETLTPGELARLADRG